MRFAPALELSEIQSVFTSGAGGVAGAIRLQVDMCCVASIDMSR
jgi:hypothetical protein